MNHIFIYGAPGTGKIALGEKLARNLALPFVDLGRVIETKAGMSIPKIIGQFGEPTFREMETVSLKAVMDDEESVIVLGDGSLFGDENRAIVEQHGRVVLLTAEYDTLLDGLNPGSNSCTLLVGDLHEKLLALLAKQGDHYNSFPLRVNVDGKTAEQNARDIQVALGRFHLAAMEQYDVIAQDNIINQTGDLFYKRGLRNPIIVTDETVEKLHAGKVLASLRNSGFNPAILSLPVGEAYKNIDSINNLWLGFIENGLDRKSTIIALGGGVINDMTGFAASTFMRGVNWVAIPTTLLSMVDASLGGKTGFDLPKGKNLIGSFYPPKLVLADPQLLDTLPREELISGLVEVVKAGIISDPELFNLCSRGLDWVKDNLEVIVKRGMAVKIQIIEEDPYERGIRSALNLGHTVGHAVELVSKYKLRHGEAVAIGIVVEAKLAERLKIAEQGLPETIAESLSALGLPTCIPTELPRDEILQAMRVDKKKSKRIVRFALPAKIGRVELVDIGDLASVLEDG
jgi:shikimate kinase/3-dehydroquinate synthase